MSTGFTIDLSENDTIDVPYRKVIGSLMYLACTSRPDIMYAVSYLSRFLDKPNQDLWTAGKRILRYLKNTIETGLFYKQGEGSLGAFSDADWAGDKSDRKSTSGSIILYAGNPINWFSKKQSCEALSTAEAEYVAAAASAQELVNLRGVLSEFRDVESAKLKVDNLSAISMMKSYENSKRTKHIDIKEHFIKDLMSKQCRLPFNIKGATRAEDTLEIIHRDVCGPMSGNSFSGARYLLMFTDDHTRMTFGYLLKNKYEVLRNSRFPRKKLSRQGDEIIIHQQDSAQVGDPEINQGMQDQQENQEEVVGDDGETPHIQRRDTHPATRWYDFIPSSIDSGNDACISRRTRHSGRSSIKL
ncbi:hypothetical protein JTB14_035638 [Gonioctena quinquepunctata]|nr:hypothetical protein JTB14_035638 [Gonioctena quinquepunctata]